MSIVLGFLLIMISNVPYIKKLNKNKKKTVNEGSATIVAYFRMRVVPYFG
jgi:hypothetical protein